MRENGPPRPVLSRPVPRRHLPDFLFFLGGTTRLLRFGLCFFETPGWESFCRF